ncbi:MAG: hypothetical protein QNI97_15010 [Desulfobacterales bacterium]|nr:hypothetical protein [Desulfobacterales bacterium]
MPRLLIVAAEAGAFEELFRALDDVPGVETLWAREGPQALERAAAESPDLVVVDESLGGQSGLDWIRRLMHVNAFIQTAAVSRLPQDAFHQAAEGLGIMAQLPPRPGKFEAEMLLRTLKPLSGTI